MGRSALHEYGEGAEEIVGRRGGLAQGGEEWRKQVTAVQTECSTSMELRGRPEPQTVSPRLLSPPPVIALLCQMALLLGEFILDLLRAK